MNTSETGTARPGGNATEIAVSRCWALVRQSVFGRLAVLHDGAPDIFPINFALDHGSIAFRTGSDALFTRQQLGRR